MDPGPTRFGEYLIIKLLEDKTPVRRWLAEQESVRRMVIIDELRPECLPRMDEFLADVRAKAGLSHPLVGTVYEAASGDGACYSALEWLPGATLAERLDAGEPMKPAKLAHVLRRVAEANCFLEAHGCATESCGPGAVHTDDNGVVRLQNLAVAGERDPGRSVADIRRLGKELRPLVADGLPGSTRMVTLCGWMSDGVEGRWLGWQDVLRYCEQIEQQLAQLTPAMTPVTASVLRPGRVPLWPIVLAAAVILLGVALVLLQGGKRKTPKPKSREDLLVFVPHGSHATPDGGKAELQGFRIAAHEVTIREYRDFLEALETHAKAGNPRIFAHENQPQEKISHQPDDWTNLLEAARSGGAWSGRKVALDSPVVGIDWWDAVAYAEWKKGRLPTQEQWFAALRQGIAEPAKLQPALWQSVTLDTPDRTANGLIGMAGSVAEWTSKPSVPPDNPAGDPKWVLMGGSYLNASNGALTREWVEARSLRRPDVGFRLVFDP